MTSTALYAVKKQVCFGEIVHFLDVFVNSPVIEVSALTNLWELSDEGVKDHHFRQTPLIWQPNSADWGVGNSPKINLSDPKVMFFYRTDAPADKIQIELTSLHPEKILVEAHILVETLQLCHCPTQTLLLRGCQCGGH
jgi:hypothetical protein